MSNSEMLIPLKVLKSNSFAFEIYQQFRKSITELSFSEIPTIEKLKQTLRKENIQTLNEIDNTKNESNGWSIELKMSPQQKITIWAKSLVNAKLECIFIGTENDTTRSKAKLAKIISSEFGFLLYYSMTGEGFIVDPKDDEDSILKK